MNRSRTIIRRSLAVIVLALAACSAPANPDVPSSDAADALDTASDGSGPCTTDLECTDRVFCNGIERCMPGATGADARGCVIANPANPCLAMQTCDETMMRCVSSCAHAPDADGDGHRSADCGGDDCDDSDANRFPGNGEVCDAANHDEDCDARTFGFRDIDMDSFVDALCCNAESGTMHCGDDCNDSRPNVHPGLGETCEGLDNNCNGMIDEGVQRTFYPDRDHDGFGDTSGTPLMGCVPEAGFAESTGDCNDADDAVHPGAIELCDMAAIDENCDGVANAPALCSCSGDVSRPCAERGACAAGTQRCVNGGWGACSITAVAEVCNGVDDNCDGTVDERLSVRCYPDGDNDGYALAGAVAADVCPVPGRDGFAGCPPNQTNRAPVGDVNIDCNDTNSTVSPGQPELCDTATVDENCDGAANPASLCMCAEGQSRPCAASGTCGAGSQTCSAGRWSACSVNPVSESCNGIDDDCDGMTDEGLTITCYVDRDNDGYAASGTPGIQSCPVMGRDFVGGCPTNQTDRAPASGRTDCNDMDAAISPAASELCDTGMVDENCDGMANPAATCACSGTMTRTCMLPGACAAGTQTCASGSWGACSISPITESCNGVDDNCNGSTDEGVTITCYADGDNDTYAAMGSTGIASCPVAGRAAVGGCPTSTTNRAPAVGAIDCNDANPAISPAAVELCDAGSVDENCDGMANPTSTCACSGTASRACPLSGACAAGTQTCASGSWGACSISPVVETCNGIDDNCNGATDESLTVTCFPDSDNDGYSAIGATAMQVCPVGGRAAVGGCPTNLTNRAPAAPNADCDDTIPSRNPGAVEVCNGVDDNCNAMTDEGVIGTFWPDVDGDGYGNAAGTSVQACVAPIGYAANNTDCDDTTRNRRPGLTESCDGLDNDCNAIVDDSAVTDPTCAIAGAFAGCRAGRCVTLACPALRGDCDGNRSNGCEANFQTDAANCGGCGISCGGALCLQGRCDGVTQIAGGYQHTCAVRQSGNVTCWGSNDFGQLGDGTRFDRTTGVLVTGVADAVQIVAGYEHTCARRATGQIVCWGQNGFGQLGNGTTTSSDTPVTVTGISDAVDVTAGWQHTCARRATGAVVCWGRNDQGQLGDGTTTNRLAPVGVTVTNVAEIAAGGKFTCARQTAGTVLCWGANGSGQIGDGTTTTRPAPTNVMGLSNATGLAAAQATACARTATSGIVCWGDNSVGEVGDGTFASRTAPGSVSGITTALAVVADGNAFHFCALLADGSVTCWGAGSEGQLGNGATSNSNVPVAVTGIGGSNPRATQIAGGGYHTCALRSEGSVVCWGGNDRGQLGDGSSFPRTTPVLTSGVVNRAVVQVVAGNAHTCARRASGAVLCWGLNAMGQLGDGSTTNRTAPVPVSGLSDAVEIAAGVNHTCARQSSGSVVCWGSNNTGQLGDGTTTNRTAPVSVTGIADAIALAAGNGHTCALRLTGRVVCWGSSSYGQLGDGTTATRLAPGAAVTGIANAVEVASEYDHTCARLSTGAIACWGADSDGRCGAGTTALSRTTPVNVVGIDDALHVASGGMSTCAVRANATVSCWGSNDRGQIGDGGPVTSRTSPAMVSGILDASTVATGFAHACALRATGAVACWGGGSAGALGDGGFSSRPTPVSVVGITNATSIATGVDHSCALRADGTVSCWGSNASGQLGDGSTSSSPVPVRATGLP